jgi:hypothetical protein
MSIWETSGGVPIVDGSGSLIECDDCPCEEEEGTCPTYPEIPDFLMADISFSDSPADPACVGCSALDGIYVIDWSGHNATDGTCVEEAFALTCQWGETFDSVAVIDCDGDIPGSGALDLRIAMNIYADGTIVLVVETYRIATFKKDGPFLGLPIVFTSADKWHGGPAFCDDTLEDRDCVLDSITISA